MLGGGRDGLWVCASKSSVLRRQEYLRVHVGWTEPDSFFHLSCLPSLSKDPGQRPSVLQVGALGIRKQGKQNLGQVLRGLGSGSIEPLTWKPEENVVQGGLAASS